MLQFMGLQIVRHHPEVRREGREPLPDHVGESPLLSRSGGEKGLRGSGAGTLGVPLEGTRRVGGLLGKSTRKPVPENLRNRNGITFSYHTHELQAQEWLHFKQKAVFKAQMLGK